MIDYDGSAGAGAASGMGSGWRPFVKTVSPRAASFASACMPRGRRASAYDVAPPELLEEVGPRVPVLLPGVLVELGVVGHVAERRELLRVGHDVLRDENPVPVGGARVLHDLLHVVLVHGDGVRAVHPLVEVPLGEGGPGVLGAPGEVDPAFLRGAAVALGVGPADPHRGSLRRQTRR